MTGRIGPDGSMHTSCTATRRIGRDSSSGRRQIQEAVDVRQMAAIELVELDAVGGIVLRAVPPAPVAAFGDQQFFERQLPLLLRTRWSAAS